MTRHRAPSSPWRALLLAAPVAVLALGFGAARGRGGPGDAPADGTAHRVAASAHAPDVPAPAAEPAAEATAEPTAEPTAGPRRRAAAGLALRAVAVLHRWDARRAAALAAGSPARLRALYVGDVGRADVRLLRGYRARGFTVRGLRVQLLAVRVLAHRPGVWRLRVTDRLAAATAVGRGHRLTLPRDSASTRLLTLRRAADGRWLMARVSVPARR